jgi:hypothetical protein
MSPKNRATPLSTSTGVMPEWASELILRDRLSAGDSFQVAGLALPTHCRIAGSRKWQAVRTTDISGGGVLFLSPNFLGPGEDLELRFRFKSGGPTAPVMTARSAVAATMLRADRAASASWWVYASFTEYRYSLGLPRILGKRLSRSAQRAWDRVAGVIRRNPPQPVRST